jgi:hypothetical protein
MATATARKTSEPAGRCGLTLRINGQSYKVRPLPTDFGGIKAFRLTKADGTFHDVSQDVYGVSCTCGDQAWRREGIDWLCC